MDSNKQKGQKTQNRPTGGKSNPQAESIRESKTQSTSSK